MNSQRVIFLVNLYTVCIGTIFVLPILLPYYQERLGLTFRDFMIGEAIFAAVIIALEVPSGWLSDVWSRKRTLMIGCITASCGYLLLLCAQGFWTAMLAQAVLGIGVACNSGTVTSILYDALAVDGKTHLYKKLEAKRHALGLYAVAGGSMAGGFLYQFDMRLPLMLDVLTCLAAFVAAALIVEPPRVKRAAVKTPLRDMAETMRYALHGHKEIAGIILVSTILFCTTKQFMWTQQPYMQRVDIPTAWFGVLMAGSFLFGGIAGHAGHRIDWTVRNRTMIACLVALPVAAGLLAAAFPVPGSLIFILLISGVWGFGFPFVQNAINKHADPARRATILSTLGLLISLLFIPVSLVSGFLDDHFSILAVLCYLSLQLALIGGLGLFVWRRGDRGKAL